MKPEKPYCFTFLKTAPTTNWALIFVEDIDYKRDKICGKTIKICQKWEPIENKGWHYKGYNYKFYDTLEEMLTDRFAFLLKNKN